MMENTNASSKRNEIMNDKARKGRKILLVIISIMLLTSAITIIFYNMSGAPNKLISQGIRFVLTAILCIYMYKGNRVAKKITAVLMALATLFGGYTFFIFHKVPIINIVLFIYMTIFGVIAYFLTYSKDIKAYFEHFQLIGTSEPVLSSEENISGNDKE